MQSSNWALHACLFQGHGFMSPKWEKEKYSVRFCFACWIFVDPWWYLWHWGGTCWCHGGNQSGPAPPPGPWSTLTPNTVILSRAPSPPLLPHPLILLLQKVILGSSRAALLSSSSTCSPVSQLCIDTLEWEQLRGLSYRPWAVSFRGHGFRGHKYCSDYGHLAEPSSHQGQIRLDKGGIHPLPPSASSSLIPLAIGSNVKGGWPDLVL